MILDPRYKYRGTLIGGIKFELAYIDDNANAPKGWYVLSRSKSHDGWGDMFDRKLFDKGIYVLHVCMDRYWDVSYDNSFNEVTIIRPINKFIMKYL